MLGGGTIFASLGAAVLGLIGLSGGASATGLVGGDDGLARRERASGICDGLEKVHSSLIKTNKSIFV